MSKKMLLVFALTLGLAAAAPAQSAAQAPLPVNPEADKAAVVQTALDYGDGFYAGEVERMERAIHPDLNKVVVQAVPQSGNAIIGYTTFSMLVELTRAKVAFCEPAARKISADVLALDGGVACARVKSAQFNDYLLQVKDDGHWKIVGVLWTPGPDSPRRAPLAGFVADQEKDNAQKLVGSFLEGTLGGDAARMEAALHPEVSVAVVRPVRPGGRPMIVRLRLSSLVEPIRAKLRTFPEDQRKFEVRVLDVMDGMAFVETKSALGHAWFQAAWINGAWKILNILIQSDPAPAPAPVANPPAPPRS